MPEDTPMLFKSIFAAAIFLMSSEYRESYRGNRYNRGDRRKNNYKEYNAQGEKINPVVSMLKDINDFNTTAALLEHEFRTDPEQFRKAFDICLPQMPLNAIGIFTLIQSNSGWVAKLTKL